MRLHFAPEPRWEVIAKGLLTLTENPILMPELMPLTRSYNGKAADVQQNQCLVKSIPQITTQLQTYSALPEDAEYFDLWVKMRATTVLGILLAFVFAFTAAWEREGMCKPLADDNKICAHCLKITSYFN